MPPTIAQLVRVRSQLAEAVIDYLCKLERKLDRTPWWRDGKPIAASGIALPARVLKESTQPVPPRPGSPRDEAGESEKRERRETACDYVDPEIAVLYEEAPREKRQEEVPWAQERLQVHRAVVLGGPGSGKSFLTQTTAIELARAARDGLQNCRASLDTLELPLHFTLARFADPALPPDPVDTILELVRLEYSPAPCFLSWLKQRLTSPTTWLILDALDEVQGTNLPILTSRLGAMGTQGWQTRVLLTCRPANYSRGLVPWGELTEYELAPFNPLEIRQFVQRWFASDQSRSTALVQVADRNYSLAHAARTPLIATFLCLAHEQAPVTETTRRVDLYERLLLSMCCRAWKEPHLRLADGDDHPHDLMKFLPAMALPLFSLHPSGNLFTWAELMGVLKTIPDRPSGWVQHVEKGDTVFDFRDELLETGILVKAGLLRGAELQYSFAHRSLLEYLVARNLSEQAKPKPGSSTEGNGENEGWGAIAGFVDKKSWHPAWRETVLFLAGLLTPDDALSLLALLANPATDDATRQRLCLAGHCLPEVSPRPNATFAYSLVLNPTAPQQIAKDILLLLLESATRVQPYSHLTNSLPFIGAACALSFPVAPLPQSLTKPKAQEKWMDVLSRLTECLDNKHREVRWKAVVALGQVGPTAATDAVLGRLVECLRDVDYIASSARAALGKLQPGATDRELSRLTEHLHDPDRKVRSSAAKDLGIHGPAAATDSVLNGLIECLRDAESDVRLKAAEALGKLGPTVATDAVLSRLIECLRDDDKNLRRNAVEAFCRLRPTAATEMAVSRLTECLRDVDRDVRFGAMVSLGNLGPVAATDEVVNRLTECLCDVDIHVRVGAAGALGEMGPAAATDTVLALLTDYLRDADRDPQWSRAAEALGKLVRVAATNAVVNRLTEWLRNADSKVRSKAAAALGKVGPAAATDMVVSRLTECLRDAVDEVRSNAAEALGNLGPTVANDTVLSRLVECLRDADRARSKMRARPLDAWWNMGIHPEEEVWLKSVAALRNLGPLAVTNAVLSRLTEYLRDADSYLRYRAATALAALGPTAAAGMVVSSLSECLRDADMDVRERAAAALGILGPAAVTDVVVSRLTELLCDAERHVKLSATAALGRLGRAAATPEVLERLTNFLFISTPQGPQAGENLVREWAAKTLERFLRAGVRWFPTETGGFRITTVDVLSGEET